jgi:hypothetical protein
MVLALAGAAGAADDPLAVARVLYNARDFDGAIAAAERARLLPQRSDSADLIAARAYLERYRQTAAPEDLASGRDRLRRLNTEGLDPRERTELLIGLGETLFFDDAPGAAADMFDVALSSSTTLDAQARERVLDWWATALDREARPRPEFERQALYQKIRDRMREELVADPATATASYWLSAAALGQGDPQSAWDAAQAAWVRAPLAFDRGAALKADLDRLVERGIAPERSKRLGKPVEVLQAEWQQFKDRWER